MKDSKLTRSQTDKIIAGICGGIAEQLEIDPVFIRIGFLILLFASGIGFPIYMILWLVMPEIKGNNDDRYTDSYDLKKQSGAAGTVGIVLIMLGTYFLFDQWGWFGGNLIWILAVIGLGALILLHKAYSEK